MKKKFLPNLLIVILLIVSNAFIAMAGNELINFNFQSTTFPSGVTSNGVPNPTKAADGVCSKGMVQINAPTSTVPTIGYLQVDISSCSIFNLNMKSTAASERKIAVKYKKEGDAGYTTLTTTLAVQAAASFNLATLFPVIISGGPISIRIEPTSGNIQVHDLYVESNSSLSTAAEITGFTIPGQVGNEVINSGNGTIAIQVLSGTPISFIVPSSIKISALATINPLGSVAQDFSNGKEVTYTVTAQDGTTTKVWKVKLTEVASDAKEIIAFKLTNNQIGEAVINSGAGTIVVSMPLGTDLTQLTPVTLTLSDHATIAPLAGAALDFSSPVTYTVTAQNSSTKVWTVTVTPVDPGATYYSYQTEDAEFTGKTDNQHANYTGTGFVDFLAGGENSIVFTVCQKQAGEQIAAFRYSLAKDDIRQGKLYVNDAFVKLLDFPRTDTFNEWKEESAIISLTAGLNKIKIIWEITDGPNLDKLSLTGEPCPSYTLNILTTNSGKVTVAPGRSDNNYFEGETVTLLAENKANLLFENWSGDLTGNANPAQIVMNGNKSITGSFHVVNTYKLNVTKTGIGLVELSPAGGEYADGTVVTITASTVLGSVLQGWGGNLSGNKTAETIVMNSNKDVTASFTSTFNIDFNKPVGFASSVTTEYPNFNGPTKGGMNSADTLWVNGPSEFDKLAILLQDRIKAYKEKKTNLSAKYAPLTIVLKEGIYTGSGTSSPSYGNSMLTIQEQGDLTIMGEKNVVLKFGINIKRSWNILIRNITFQDYYDDGINIGEPETHHIWIDHCTVGHPTTMPADSEHPDGGIDVKGGASYVTISWCNYRNSWKTGLVGHSDSNGAEDTGKLKVTYYGNYFYKTNSRNPRVRFGQVHVLNNLEEQVMLYGIVAANKAEIYAENNFFLNTDWPMYADRSTADFKTAYGNNSDGTYTSKTGNYPCIGLKQSGNEYDDSSLPVITAQINSARLNPGGRSIKFDELNPEVVFNPKNYYSYEAFPASVVRTIVPMFAGADKVSFVVLPAPAPSLATTGVLIPFKHISGIPSSKQTYVISGNNLTGNVTVTPPVNYEVSVDAGITWFTNSSPLTLIQNGGNIASTNIQVRLNASLPGNFEGNIIHATPGAASINTFVSGTTTPVPAIIATGVLNSFVQPLDSASVIQNYNVSGTDLIDNITVTPPVGFEISNDGGTSWKNNASPLTLVPVNGMVAPVNIKVKLSAASLGSYSGIIVHNTAVALTVNVGVEGTVTELVATGFRDNVENLSFTISPNPADQNLVIHHSSINQSAIISIYNCIGKKAFSYKPGLGTMDTSIDISALGQGIYFAEYQIRNKRAVIKFIKQ